MTNKKDLICNNCGGIMKYHENEEIFIPVGDDNKRNKIEIQKRIVITQKDVDKIIKQYEKMPKKFHLAMGEFSGNKNKIIEEIRKLSEVGKQILLIDYNYNKFMEKDKLKQRSKG